VGANRFLAEIKTTANLQHPHILPLFDSGQADGFLSYRDIKPANILLQAGKPVVADFRTPAYPPDGSAVAFISTDSPSALFGGVETAPVAGSQSALSRSGTLLYQRGTGVAGLALGEVDLEGNRRVLPLPPGGPNDHVDYVA